MPLQQRRFLIAVMVLVVVVTVIGGVIGWTSHDFAQLLIRGQSVGLSASPVIEAGAAANRSATLPITPGDWRWRREGDTSAAQFAGALVTVACDLPTRTISVRRRAEAAETQAVTILTSTQSRSFRGRKLGEQIEVTLASGDALLDAIALSRGRFGIEVAGLDAIYPASWAEVSRVIEDCRGPSA